MRGADAADGGLVAALARAGELVDHQRGDAGLCQEYRRRQADAPGADDDHVVDLGTHHMPPSCASVACRRGSSSAGPPSAVTPAKAPSGTSMKRGRRVRSVTWSGGTPSSRKIR